MSACASNNNFMSSYFEKEKSCINFLKTLNCYDIEIELLGDHAFNLNQLAKKNKTTPYELSTRVSHATCKSRGWTKEDDECNAFTEWMVMSGYDNNVCKELIYSDYPKKDKVFNIFVKKYSQCYIYKEKYPKPFLDEVVR
jgi:hypothetical protein